MILDQVHVVSELGQAVADCSLVAATSARTGKLIRGQFGPPHEIMPILAEAAKAGTVALVFGPESSGLTNEELTRCHYLVHIPTDNAYAALNLAQAVAICLYELRVAVACPRSGVGMAPEIAPAPFAEQERMFADLRTALEEIHFLYGPKADSLMHALRHLIGRAQPTAMEVKMLMGLARQIRWYVQHHHQP
jgi:tRNA/rRNA methyltransferase